MSDQYPQATGNGLCCADFYEEFVESVTWLLRPILAFPVLLGFLLAVHAFATNRMPTKGLGIHALFD